VPTRLHDGHGTPIIRASGKTPRAKEFSSARQRMTMMFDEQLVRMRTHRNNIQRYRYLLQTRLTELEREFIEMRLAEEQSKLESLAASTFPPAKLRGAAVRGAPDLKMG
jgi:hypothetical protein